MSQYLQIANAVVPSQCLACSRNSGDICCISVSFVIVLCQSDYIWHTLPYPGDKHALRAVIRVVPKQDHPEW